MTVLVITMILLTGCGQTVFRTNMEIYCPTLKSYADDHGGLIADELVDAEEFVDMTNTIDTLEDYYALRKKVEACHAESKKGVN